MKLIRHVIALAGAFGAMLIGACAAEPIPDDADLPLGGGGSTEGPGGAGGEGGEPPVDPCDQDCGAIAAPSCFVGVCNTGQHAGPVGSCVVVPEATGTSCDDGQFCTVDDQCDGNGVCLGQGENDCGLSAEDCHEVVCNETSKACDQTPVANGEPCIASDLCLVGATCQGGTCGGGTVKDCFFAPVPNECHAAVCNPANGACEPVEANDGQGCVDLTDLCTVGKTCSAGQCVGGAPKDCSAQTVQCVEGVCDAATGSCTTMPLLPGESCSAATNACNQGVCDANGVCQPQPVNEGGVCDDGNSCTSGETCQSGQCTGGTTGGYELYFQETFASNTAGWTLGPEWQIGPAVASSCATSQPGEDPATDHTPTSDNGVAGVVIGGCASKAVLPHPYYYLESPPIDVSTASGSVYLQFWRWLVSDYWSLNQTYYMRNRVEVFDGSSWVVLWESGASAIRDTAWTEIVHDLTPYKNANLRVRFGFEMGTSSAVFTIGSWSVDDVTIANQVCIN